jgi:hypothetical protein
MTPPAERPDIEAKYTFAAAAADLIRAGLEAVCVRDPEHPTDVVNSIYYDTLDRTHLAEKVNSDYLKTKVRLRWYSPPEGTAPDEAVTAFLEVKSKRGVVRRKHRVSVDVRFGALRRGEERFEELEETGRLAIECGYFPPGPIFPMIAIRYTRHRFFEPRTAARISLDSGIAYTGINDRFFVGTGPRTLSMGVLEVKSSTGNLPPSFLAIRHFLNRRDSFSKYEECWQLHADPLYRREFQWMHFGR